MKSSRLRILKSLCAIPVLTACGGGAGVIDGLEHTAEIAVTSVASLLDELALDAFEKANCTSGDRAATQTCSGGGVRTLSSISCTTPIGGATLTGSSTLTYSSLTCLMSTVGEVVTRTFSLTKTGSTHSFVSSSTAETDYRGNSISGGQRLTVGASSTYSLEIVGENKRKVRVGGGLSYSGSVRTLSAMTVSGAIARAGRTVTGGSLEVAHNALEYTATYVFSSVAWGDSACCYPKSGTAAITLSEGGSGTATLAFSSDCGVATLTQDGFTEEVTFTGCE